ncbi:VMAP-C domain-containing protein [Leptolyngbya boryana]|nr:effector-associated domain EAD1-containing protein [Leptolyngbya boryana]
MLQLSNDDRRTLREALISGFRSYEALERFVADNFKDFRLNEISDSRSTLDAADRLIEACEERGDELALVLALRKERPRNAAVQNLLRFWQGRVPGDPLLVQREPNDELAFDSEDPCSAHLVIAVFRQQPSEQKFRVQPKLCYRNAETSEIVQESLMKDSCSILLKEFPNFFKKLVGFTIRKISDCFTDPLHPWQLTIELFIPLELLCSPLTIWCGQDSELLLSRPIVVGCSDRFDPDQLEQSADLHNQLKRGWRRFQEKAPDQAGSTLQNLSWLNSDIAHQENFEGYSGFQCYGAWLTPDKESLKNWQTLVKSGIPLALWMCEGQPQRETISATFDRLIDCTRFEFLERIPRIRDEQRRTCNHCVGILYEDPNYIPDVPRVEEQFFSWPGA